MSDNLEALAAEVAEALAALEKKGGKSVAAKAAKKAQETAEERIRSRRILAQLEAAEHEKRARLVPVPLIGQNGPGFRAKTFAGKDSQHVRDMQDNLTSHAECEGVKRIKVRDGEKTVERYTQRDARAMQEEVLNPPERFRWDEVEESREVEDSEAE